MEQPRTPAVFHRNLPTEYALASLEVAMNLSKKDVQISEIGEYSISAYQGEIVSDITLAQGICRLKAAFPKQSEEFFDLLSERVIANEMTEEQFRDAVNRKIDNSQWNNVSIFDIVGYDRQIKLYHHTEVCSGIGKNWASFNDFKKKKVDENLFWILKSDLAKLGYKTD